MLVVVLVVKNPSASAGDSGSITETGRHLEEGMTTHSSILAWRITWTEESGRLQSIGLNRVGHVLLGPLVSHLHLQLVLSDSKFLLVSCG